jgi:hypothetical protein
MVRPSRRKVSAARGLGRCVGSHSMSTTAVIGQYYKWLVKLRASAGYSVATIGPMLTFSCKARRARWGSRSGKQGASRWGALGGMGIAPQSRRAVIRKYKVAGEKCYSRLNIRTSTPIRAGFELGAYISAMVGALPSAARADCAS